MLTRMKGATENYVQNHCICFSLKKEKIAMESDDSSEN